MKRNLTRLLLSGCALAISACSSGGGANPAVAFTVTGAPSTAVAGTPVVVTLQAIDVAGKPTTNYLGTVNVSTDDPAAAAVPDVVFAGVDKGVKTVSVTLKTQGEHVVAAKDSKIGTLRGSGSVLTSPASASVCALSGPGAARAGDTVAFRATITDAYGNTSLYGGSLQASTTDAAGQASAFGAGGAAGVAARLVTAGTQTVTLADAASAFKCSRTIAITHGAPVMAVAAASDANAGAPVAVTVTLKDALGNAVTDYLGTVAFTSSDTGAGVALPTNYTFVAGDAGQHTFSAKLATLGSQSITATDTGASTLTGTASTRVHGLVYTNPSAAAGKIQIVADPSSTPVSVVLNVSVAQDIFAAFGAGFDLPLDATKVSLDGTAPITAGAAGFSGPLVTKAVLGSGPFANRLFTVISQQFTPPASSPQNSFLVAPSVMYSVKLNLAAAATTGVVFDGGNLGAGYRAAVRDQEGNDYAQSPDFAFGKLEVR